MPREIIEELTGGVNLNGLQAQMIRIGLGALSSRVLVWTAALGAGSVWTYTVLVPDWMRLIAAAGYCLFVFIPVLVRDAKIEGGRS
jgi:hypothetical protein